MHVGQQMIRAEITVRRYNRSSCLMCQDEGWRSASFIHCRWKYEGDLRHLVLAQKGKGKTKKAANDKWHVILSYFWPRRSLGCSTTAANIFRWEPSSDLSRDEQVFVRRRSGREEDAFAFLLLIANIQWQPTLFAVVFVGMRAHARCLSAWVDSKSSLY